MSGKQDPFLEWLDGVVEKTHEILDREESTMSHGVLGGNLFLCVTALAKAYSTIQKVRQENENRISKDDGWFDECEIEVSCKDTIAELHKIAGVGE